MSEANPRANDVRQLLDERLPEGLKCEAVTMVEIYTAIINGDPVAVQCDRDEPAGRIADAIVSQVTPPAAQAEPEGTEHPEPVSEATPRSGSF